MRFNIFTLIFVITFISMERYYENIRGCRLDLQVKGIEIASVVDSCKKIHRTGYGIFLRTPSIHIYNLSNIDGKVAPGDSVYKPAGTMMFYVYKNSDTNNCICVQENLYMSKDCEECN